MTSRPRTARPRRRTALVVALSALATVGPMVPAAAAAEPAAAEPAAPTTDSRSAPSMSAAPDSHELPRLGDRSRPPLPPLVLPQQPAAPDHRPVYIGAGLVVMAVVFWWNRRRRDSFEREESPPPRASRDRARRRDRDEDADDLHAAARGDAPDPRDSPDPPDPPDPHDAPPARDTPERPDPS